ncbi:hypothetical protein LTR92_011768, partial [Exophiala xenobiotica]
GQEMKEGEYLSMREIHSYMPDLVPKLRAWGEFNHSPPNMYFLLMEFIDLGSEMVEAPGFCGLNAHLHQMGISPTGKFGFFRATYYGHGRVTGAATSRGYELSSLTEISQNGNNQPFQEETAEETSLFGLNTA